MMLEQLFERLRTKSWEGSSCIQEVLKDESFTKHAFNERLIAAYFDDWFLRNFETKSIGERILLFNLFFLAEISRQEFRIFAPLKYRIFNRLRNRFSGGYFARADKKEVIDFLSLCYRRPVAIEDLSEIEKTDSLYADVVVIDAAAKHDINLCSKVDRFDLFLIEPCSLSIFNRRATPKYNSVTVSSNGIPLEIKYSGSMDCCLPKKIVRYVRYEKP